MFCSPYNNTFIRVVIDCHGYILERKTRQVPTYFFDKWILRRSNSLIGGGKFSHGTFLLFSFQGITPREREREKERALWLVLGSFCRSYISVKIGCILGSRVSNAPAGYDETPRKSHYYLYNHAPLVNHPRKISSFSSFHAFFYWKLTRVWNLNLTLISCLCVKKERYMTNFVID